MGFSCVYPVKKSFHWFAYCKKLVYLPGNMFGNFIFMSNIFEIRELGVCKKVQVEVKTAFACYELKVGEEMQNLNLPLNYILFVSEGAVDLSCNEFENRKFEAGEMVFVLRSSSVRAKVLKKAKLHVFYFDTFMSSCDRQLFKAYLPDVEKITYDFSPVPVPNAILQFLEQILCFQKDRVDCVHFNSLKHQEFFILLRHYCSKEDIVGLLAPLICRSLDFRTRVLDKYMLLENGRVSELADLVGMGRKTFDKRFREEFGTSPAKWMQEEKAKRLHIFLAEPGITISDAMDKFHFNSQAHFNRFCHQYFNASPGALIKRTDDINIY